MPKTRARAAAATKVSEPVMPAELEEQVELDGFEEMEEEVEYEEVEEEVEEELEEEEEEVVLEEEEEDIEDEGVEEESDDDAVNGAPAKANVTLANKDPVKEDGENLEDESKKHAELLALPPHGSEVYVGGIPPDAAEEELRNFCESAGEVTEVICTFYCKCNFSLCNLNLFQLFKLAG